ncbi:bifunctional sugar-binding transcriptional regulator/dihydroxyacetone kinase subunit DhaK [Mangrovicella endophytica]|uniref:bifunctional sugar-binding transcriptional regulator/dihydroxyacetone kinase subunit DhaK n=1 Tax=Mangrovicella endophytica TaxID=2066697 RepID=UPI001FE03CEC|nr:bifunctional sugar-binding transcriptional regulator/dihydroxyacetone kinase subunit DhaK [Mangrovicella endophytica]
MSANRRRPLRTPAAEGGAGIIPLRFGDDPQVWACWLYYEDRLTQGEVADAMGISRATVNAYLADARERGIVNITLDPHRLASLTIAQELKRHFGLHDCLVVPSQEPGDSLIDSLGSAGSLVLRRLLRSGDTLAVTWGRTVLAVASATSITGLQDVRVVQATGGMTASIVGSPEACAARLAAGLGAACVPITAPGIVSSAEMRDMLMAEPLLRSQFAALGDASRALFGVASLRPNSTIHSSGFFDAVPLQDYLALNAVGVVAGRFIDVQGQPVRGPLDERLVGLSLDSLRQIERRIAVAGGIDKVPAILGALRGGYADVLVTDAATGKALLDADGASALPRPAPRSTAESTEGAGQAEVQRRHVKKFLNDPDDIVDEMLDGALRAHSDYLVPVQGARRAFMARTAPRPGRVGLVVGGGSGHEPCFLGYVGTGMADAVAVGNIFSSPPPDPIARAARAVSGGQGVLFVYGNYAGDTMNFEMASELVQADGIPVRSVVTTDDVASSRAEDRDGRRGVAGNVLVFKVAGAACDRGWPLDACERVARRANARTFTMGVALEPCSMPQTRRYSFSIGPGDMEVGVGIHGEPGVAREPMQSADAIVDMAMNRIFAEMQTAPGDRVAVLVNSFGSTPLMELYVLYRRVEQRLRTKNLTIAANWVGHYCTSLDMAGASITIMHLDDELADLLGHPCDTPFFKVGP